MKKLFSVLFVSLFILGSCTKLGEECNNGCSDNELVGYWKDGDVAVFIGEGFTGTFFYAQYELGGEFTCTDGYLNFVVPGDVGWVANYTISGTQMQLNISDGWDAAIGNYTLTKQ
tara:strand:- start:2100 stop:2444 length:345 start_codon:yes stop_codon:yes gene_type:complete